MNYYPFHIGDFRSGTVNMSRLSRWIYRDMLDVYYDSEQPLSLDLDQLCDQLGVEQADERMLVERLLRFKFTKEDDGYHHDICQRVISEYHAKADIAKANGKLGGRPPKKPTANPAKPSGFLSGSDPDAIRNPAATGSEANQEPITNNHKPVTKEKKPSPTGDDMFPGVDPQVVDDFKALRKQKRAPVTPTAMAKIVAEAGKAGLTLEAALRICCSRGWQGFEADWLSRRATDGRALPQPSRHSGFENIDYSEGIEDGRII